ncbi:MAG: glycerol-3-phosphate dehydrogenase [Nitrospirae bacterium GWB2_47_37]|nr:MAG: glycerol-3-phosphate dehydrogenase [Nitrospirae bacterium GWA2_46_11]OGW23792.1 MAG: glycerol-3-phosphate dehydrogenase [Nitrospirae bacterium GWB2_47_37]HAK89389.1 glycerol-3-phosphate dehydrogenase [Nitrospiraceae bacterium]
MNYPNSYISVIGAGSWGTTLASLLADKGYDVTLWTHETDLAERINKERVNNLYLPGITLSNNVKAVSDIAEAVSMSRYILNVIPTQYIRPVFTQAKQYIKEESIIISASKGIEIETLLTPSMLLKEILGKPVSIISGPSFAKEVALRLPTAVTLATEDKKTGLLLQEIFNSDYFRVYTHDDIIGVEIGGALKNVIAIASGICEGLGLGHNSRAALITRGLSEITRVGMAMNAREITFSGLSGLGDLVLTCTGPLSRNYTVGCKLGQGQKLSDIVSGTMHVAEGVTTTRAAYDLSKKLNIDMPITEQVYLTLYKDKPPKEAVRDLMNRTLKSEFYGY